MQSLFPIYKDDDRIWVYQADIHLSEDQIVGIEDSLSEFFSHWKSHGGNVKADYKILYNRFIILIADAADPLCGRAMDASIRFVKETGEKMKIDFLNRTQVACLENNSVLTFLVSELPGLFEKRVLTENTLIFNNSVSSKKEFENNWLIELKDSWLKMKIPSEKVS